MANIKISNSKDMEEKVMFSKEIIERIVELRTEAIQGGGYIEASNGELEDIAEFLVDCGFDYSKIGDYSFSEKLYDIVNSMSDREKSIFWGKVESLLGFDSLVIYEILEAVEDYIHDCDDYIDVLDYKDAEKYAPNVSSWYIIENFSEVAHNLFADLANSYYGVNPIQFLNTCLAHTIKVIFAKLLDGRCDLSNYLSEEQLDTLGRYESLLTGDFAVLCILNYRDCGWAMLSEKIAESLN